MVSEARISYAAKRAELFKYLVRSKYITVDEFHIIYGLWKQNTSRASRKIFCDLVVKDFEEDCKTYWKY